MRTIHILEDDEYRKIQDDLAELAELRAEKAEREVSGAPDRIKYCEKHKRMLHFNFKQNTS